jgi:hypothetical protein
MIHFNHCHFSSKTMKKLILNVLTIILSTNPTFAQKLTFKEKKIIKGDIRIMLKTDQKYRVELTDSDFATKEQQDSLWTLQTIADRENKEKLKSIIHQYGYPSYERIRLGYVSVVILHFTNPSELSELDTTFHNEVRKGNMSAIDYARWYDRCLKNKNEPTKYGVYGVREVLCGEELKRVNANRNTLQIPNLIENIVCP